MSLSRQRISKGKTYMKREKMYKFDVRKEGEKEEKSNVRQS